MTSVTSRSRKMCSRMSKGSTKKDIIAGVGHRLTGGDGGSCSRRICPASDRLEWGGRVTNGKKRKKKKRPSFLLVANNLCISSPSTYGNLVSMVQVVWRDLELLVPQCSSLAHSRAIPFRVVAKATISSRVKATCVKSLRNAVCSASQISLKSCAVLKCLC